MLRPACACAQSDQCLCQLLVCSTNIKLLTEHHLEFLSLKGGCTGSYESTLVKMPHCRKSHVTAHLLFENKNLYQSIAIIISTLCDTDLKCPFNRDNLDHKDPFNLLSHDTY